ncbi:MAG: OmpH family outer membrane protein [Bacteroidetes bacterium]|nr:OmpH family outer membrane protein [Bacteroidota bacterium]
MKRMSRIGVLLILITPIISDALNAQTLKIGYADPEVIITYMPEYQTVQQQMAVEYRTSQEALQALAEDFQERVEKYQKQQPLLSVARQAEREQELAQLQAEIQTSAAAKDQELAKKQEEMMAPLLERVQTVIDEVAVEKGLDIIIRSPALLYVNEDHVVNLNIEIAQKLGIVIDESESGN